MELVHVPACDRLLCSNFIEISDPHTRDYICWSVRFEIILALDIIRFVFVIESTCASVHELSIAFFSN
jgi:hypothetical protein